MNWTNKFKTCCWSWEILLFTLFVKNGLCNKESNSVGQAENPSSSPLKESLKHSHTQYDGWPTMDKARLPWDKDLPEMPNIVPLTLQEQSLRQTKSNYPRFRSNTKTNGQDSNKKIKKPLKDKISNTSAKKSPDGRTSSTKQKGKSFGVNEEYDTNNPDASQSATQEEDLPSIQEKALSFGKLVLEFVQKEVLPKVPNDLLSSIVSQAKGRSSFSDDSVSESRGFPKAQRKQEAEGGGGEINRNQAIGWLARLIGVDGKTLGEFLREYQVHVLYDLVFTFFKWIFFLYAGLLIP